MKYIIIVLLSTCLGGSLVAGVFLTMRSPALTTTETQINLRSFELKDIQDIAELRTANQQIEFIVEGNRANRSIIGGNISETQVLYIASIKASAGVDLSELNESSIEQISNDSFVITLPPPVLFDAYLDIENSRVYDVSSSLFSPATDASDLLVEVQRQAEEEASIRICNSDLLETASDTAVIVVENLFSSIPDIEVEVIPNENQSCNR